MVKAVFKGFRILFALPLKATIYAALVAAGACLGVFGPSLWEAGTEALALLQSSANDSTFDPQVLLSPEKELDLIRDVKEDTEPRLKRAQILIRKQRAEIEYLKERSTFIEERVPRGPGETRTGTEILRGLEATLADSTSATDEVRERFDRWGGPRWTALREKSQALEDSLKDLLRMQDRVEFLHDRLEQRRLATLRFAPDNERDSKGTERKMELPEVEESRQLLSQVHEELFKTVYALDPTLVRERPEVASHASGE